MEKRKEGREEEEGRERRRDGERKRERQREEREQLKYMTHHVRLTLNKQNAIEQYFNLTIITIRWRRGVLDVAWTMASSKHYCCDLKVFVLCVPKSRPL